ncbi:S8 family serine peptidase [Niabella yanshanensis]|uniref:S8 family serine peptidase n=1 Tax=Niabella yanshanensis TaxID=577386 RepID=A0ABZ0W1N2_9BACT|nr:S8 family serine peptidase [Niabella yanshanensis]WQD36991.1 S8 family serine peptidase [Niabella yanshanensis]
MKNRFPDNNIVKTSATGVSAKLGLWIISCLFLLLCMTACKKEKLPETEPPAANFSVSPSSITLSLNDSYSIPLYVLKDKDTLPASEVVWESENEQIVAFYSPGVIEAKWAGQTNVIAQGKDGKELARCVVTVTDSNIYKLRLILKDKDKHATLSVNNPSGFLSGRAIQRRQKQSIAVDENDLPIADEYLQEIAKIGGTIVAKSKWLKTVSVHVNDPTLLQKYKALSFIADAKIVWAKRKNAYQGPAGSWSFPGGNTAAPHITIGSDNNVYGRAFENIRQNKGNALHQLGFKGRNMLIAVIDAGFKDANKNTMLNNLHVVGAKSFIYEQPDPFFMDEHGGSVLSIIGGAKPAQYIGAAPEASYLLLTSEDNTDEYPIEEDYYVNALEYADSAGVDVVNTSLGYKEFPLPGMTNTFEILNGTTAHASRGVSMAFSKGILVVVSAGNDGSFVGSPADSPGALAVGMANAAGSVITASSRGMTVDGRIKPDVIAMGAGAYRINSAANVVTGTGTSYAAPAMTGMAACLWQAFPNLTNQQVRDIIRQSADRYASPTLPYGYGFPDMQKAYTLAQSLN